MDEKINYCKSPMNIVSMQRLISLYCNVCSNRIQNLNFIPDITLSVSAVHFSSQRVCRSSLMISPTDSLHKKQLISGVKD